MKEWQKIYEEGRSHIEEGRYRQGVVSLERALELCPESEEKTICAILYSLAQGLEGVGSPGAASRCRLMGGKLLRSSLCGSIMTHGLNGYGMTSRGGNPRDDYRAFYTIQMKKYLVGKGRSFDTDPEIDMIRELISQAWEELLLGQDLRELSVPQKVVIFKSVFICFPFDTMESFSSMGEEVLHVDFRKGKVLKGEDLCSCGSGLPFGMCCGRIIDADELMCGVF